MSVALFTSTFQGEPTVVGALDPDDQRDCQRQAFPRNPPRNATSDPSYRAHKIAPLQSGRLLLSVISNGGESDVHGRPVLRAKGCVLDREALGGPARDAVAVWNALESWSPEQPVTDFEAAVARDSYWSSDAAFASLRERVSENGEFLAHAAAALSGSSANVHGARDIETIGPALALLSGEKLCRLEFATGSDDGENREAVLVLNGPAEEVADRSGGLLSGFLGRKRHGQGPATIDFDRRTVTPAANDGPVALVQALTASNTWPGISDRMRFRLLMGSVDSTWMRGHAMSPFDMSPELDAMRRTVRQIEELARKLEAWR